MMQLYNENKPPSLWYYVSVFANGT